MRHILDEQTYLNFNQETSLKLVKNYRAKYAWIDECLDANPLILWLVHEDLGVNGVNGDTQSEKQYRQMPES